MFKNIFHLFLCQNIIQIHFFLLKEGIIKNQSIHKHQLYSIHFFT